MPETRPFTMMLMRSEVSGFRRFHARLDADPPVTRGDFSDLMKAMTERNVLDPKRMADDLGTSLSAVYRWLDGSSAPHPVAWPRIVEWVKDRLDERIADAEQALLEHGNA